MKRFVRKDFFSYICVFFFVCIISFMGTMSYTMAQVSVVQQLKDVEADKQDFAKQEKLEQLRGSQGEYEKTSAGQLDKCKKSYSESYCTCKITNKGIYLNTDVPFIGQCLIPGTGGSSVLGIMNLLIKIVTTFVMIGGFGAIVWGGVLMASSGSSDDRYKKGKSLIEGVIIAFACLGSLGIILRFINPNFFA